MVDLEIIELIGGAVANGNSVTWVATDVSENGTTVSSTGDGFEMMVRATSATTGNYTITAGSLGEAYWPNWNAAPTLTGTLTIDGTDNVTFDAAGNASVVTFGGQAPDGVKLRLEWTNANDKTRPAYIMNLVPKS